jgi:hypothetical protein
LIVHRVNYFRPRRCRQGRRPGEPAGASPRILRYALGCCCAELERARCTREPSCRGARTNPGADAARLASQGLTSPRLRNQFRNLVLVALRFF